MENVKKYVDSSGLLLSSVAMQAGIPKTQYYDFIRRNGYEQVSHGVYASAECWEDELYILSLRCSSAVFSHDEALYYHGLIDREPIQKTITLYTGYGTGRLMADGVKVYTVKKELLAVGKITVQTSFGHNIPMYDLERTICDLVRSRNRFELQDYQTALKSYVVRRDKNLNCLMEYAKQFHVDRQLREYMEVLL